MNQSAWEQHKHVLLLSADDVIHDDVIHLPPLWCQHGSTSEAIIQIVVQHFVHSAFACVSRQHFSTRLSYMCIRMLWAAVSAHGETQNQVNLFQLNQYFPSCFRRRVGQSNCTRFHFLQLYECTFIFRLVHHNHNIPADARRHENTQTRKTGPLLYLSI